MSLGNLQVAVECVSCGYGAGTVEAGGTLRCVGCGRFAEETDDYCLKHNVRKDDVPIEGTCPYCREEDRLNSLEQERAARRSDPRMHPTVDAPRW